MKSIFVVSKPEGYQSKQNFAKVEMKFQLKYLTLQKAS